MSSLQDLLLQDGFPCPPPQTNNANIAALYSIISLLSGYAGRFLTSPAFRSRLHQTCTHLLTPSTAHSTLSNLQLAIDTVSRLAEEPMHIYSKRKSLRNSIRLLTVVATLDTTTFICGVPNSHLASCAQLYLAVVYKIERDDCASAQHLLQCFADAPYLARCKLVPDLWDHFLLPHLLNLKIWYHDQVEIVNGRITDDWDKRLKRLERDYNDQMDVGTAAFANYYKEWIRAGREIPPIPYVSLPLSSMEPSSGKQSKSVSARLDHRNLYLSVFGHSSKEGSSQNSVSIDDGKLVAENEMDGRNRSSKVGNRVHSDTGASQRRPSSAHECPAPDGRSVPHKACSFRLLSCHSDPSRGAICHTKSSKNASAVTTRRLNDNILSTNLEKAILLISHSDNLSEYGNAVHIVAKAWLDSHGETSLRTSLSSSSVIEGLVQVTLTSKDDEVLELAISILAELVAKNHINRQVILNVDPHLEMFLRLLRSKTLFLKAAVLLYLLRPKAKQMLSLDWIPLVLHVLDFGDQMIALFTVRCNPKLAAFYFLDQLTMGFDVDHNIENAKHAIELGGLALLIRRFETGDAREKRMCASLLVTCIRADGSCRHYLAANLKKDDINQMLLGSQLKSKAVALSLLCELLCLNRVTQIIQFLNGLKSASCLNTMPALLVYLQQASIEQRPMAGAILLQLDLLGDPRKYSVYREEGIDAIVTALEQSLQNKKLQGQCSRTLLSLGSRFSFTGDSIAEAWLLKRAGLDDGLAELFKSEVILTDEIQTLEKEGEEEEDEKVTEDWLRRLAIILLTSGNERLLVALSNCIAYGIPSLARASLVTVAWMSISLSSLSNASALPYLACSILTPRLLRSLSYDRTLEERVLASLSLLNFARHPECLPKIFPFEKETIHSLQDLAKMTWTAKMLHSACCR